MRKTTGVVLGAAAAVVVVAVGGVWLVRDGAAGRRPDRTDRAAAAWQVHKDAFPVSHGWMSGPQVLVADPKGCYAGFGRDELALGYWHAAGDCSSAVSTKASPRPVGDGLPSEDRNLILAAVPAHDGGYLAVARHTFHGDAYAYDTRIMAGGREAGDWTSVAEFDAADNEDPFASHVGPIALARTPTGYVAVGRHNERALAWWSTDGRAWSPVDLPDARDATVVAVTAAKDGRVVAVGTTDGAVLAWSSTDGGRSWRRGRTPELTGDPRVSTVLHDGRRFIALGAEDGDVRSAALMLTSKDGMVWERDQSLTEAGANSVTAATALPDGRVLAVSGDGATRETDEVGGTRDCAAAWIQGDSGWLEEGLGCEGVPTSVVTLKDGRVAAVYWSTVFIRDAMTAPGPSTPAR